MKSQRYLPAIVIVGLMTVLVTGCTTTPQPHHSAQPKLISGNQTPLMDPILALTDSSSPDFVASSIVPVIEVEGTGPHTFTVAPLTDPKEGVKFFVTCAPTSKFELTMKPGFYSTGCGREPSDSAGFPPSDSRGPGQLSISIKIPAHTTYWIVGIPYSSAAG